MTKLEKKGWICLDIDGTITADILTIPEPVLDYLKELHHCGWQIVFVTGRTFSLAHAPLAELDIPYFLVPQNGASSFSMPSKKMLTKNYVSIEVFYELEKLIQGIQHDFVFFGGFDQGEEVFYRPERLMEKTKEYFENKLTSLAGSWKTFDSLAELPFKEVPYGKIYGERESLYKILQVLKKVSSVKVHLVEDSVNPSFSILQIMKGDVDKGRAVLDIMGQESLPSPIISAGNDNNDESLLQIADVKIAMSGSPACLLDQATLVAPPVEEMGILSALELAVKLVEGKQ
ncbi:MAG: hypothetical protein S4CHLAM6_06320 [Chlamydiae bacterium]|nr:hypothetical protein [Chlamydiota bacterium]